MRALPPSQRTAVPLDADVLQKEKTPIQSLLKPLLNLSENSDYLVAGSAGEFTAGNGVFQIPRFIFMGPGGGGDTVRLGIFATFYGDQPEGAEALIEFLKELEQRPQIARGYHLYIYPVCNPAGFSAQIRHNLSGEDLTKHFWEGSAQPEIYYLEREIGVLQFHGLISLHTQNELENFALEINSDLLKRTLARPAIAATQRFVSGTVRKAEAASIETWPGSPPADFLSQGGELDPVPFELHWGIPGYISKYLQAHGTVSALTSILESYRGVLSIGQNI